MVGDHLERPAGRLAWDRLMLRLPLFRTLVIRLETARFTRTLATLLGNGLPLMEALPMLNFIGAEVSLLAQRVSTRLTQAMLDDPFNYASSFLTRHKRKSPDH